MRRLGFEQQRRGGFREEFVGGGGESSGFCLPLEMADVMRSLDFNDEAETPKATGELIKVFLRVRPLTAEEEERGEEVAVTVGPEDGMLRVKARNRSHHKGTIRETGRATFQFSTIFDEKSSQVAVFEATTKPLVEKLFEGGHGLVFAYGTTKAGKTHTIQGGPTSGTGLVHLASNMLMDTLAGKETGIDTENGMEYEVSVSCVEIYNEQCFDLLDGSRTRLRRVLRIKEDVSGDVHVEGLQNIPVNEMKDVIQALDQSMRRRRVAGTMHNERSSRSHTIFTIHLRQFKTHPGGVHELCRNASLAIVDLAGSERSSYASTLDRERMRETAQINKSLMNLARCLEVLRENQKRRDGKKHLIPYRQSRLTRLFQPSLDRGSAVMIVNISPSLRDSDETIHALTCAAIARQVHVGMNAGSYMNKENLFGCTPNSKTPKASSLVDVLAQERRRVTRLEEEVRHLQESLSQAETRACLMESEVREEAAVEMEEALASMEAEYMKRLEEATETNERRTEKRLEIVTKTARKKISRAAAESSVTGVRTNRPQNHRKQGILTVPSSPSRLQRNPLIVHSHVPPSSVSSFVLGDRFERLLLRSTRSGWRKRRTCVDSKKSNTRSRWISSSLVLSPLKLP